MTTRPAALKILVICQYYHPEPFRITDICESMVARGHDVTVLTGLPNYPEGTVLPEYRRGKRRTETRNGVSIIRCLEIGRGKGRIRLFVNYLSFAVSATWAAFFLKQDFDVAFVNQLSPVLMGVPGIAYKKRRGKKLLLYCLDLWPASLVAGGIRETSVVYRVLRVISRSIYRSADTILVTSSMFQDYLTNRLGITGVRLRDLPQYAEDVFVQPDEVATPVVPVRSGSRWNFGFAGNIGAAQSVETLVRAAGELRDRADICIHVVGDGSQAETCKQLASDLGLTNVVFHGRRPLEDMPEFYRIADAMLITMKRDEFLSYTLPGKVQTYMAAGKPILGAVDGETRRIIDLSGCGYTCAAEDYREFARLLVEFTEDAGKDRMAANSAEFYREHFSKERFLISLEDELRLLTTSSTVCESE